MQISRDIKKSQDVKKCYFSTFIDETTMTCSPNGRFDAYGFPIKLCDKLPSCNIIKEMNNDNKLRNKPRSKNGIKKIQAFL